jgi:hypothetical protein
MTFYERQTNTLILRLMEPLDERTTYAVVVTRRLRDAAGQPVGSPFPGAHHAAQTATLRPLLEVLPVPREEVAFAFAFTTQSIGAHWKAVRDGLHGHGVQAHLAALAPGELTTVERLYDAPDRPRPHLLHGEAFRPLLLEAAAEFLGLDESLVQTQKLLGSVEYIDYLTIGSFDSPQLMPRTGAHGEVLPFDDQVWPPDLDRVPAPATNQRIWFTLIVPRKEVSARGEGKPAPLVILGHGYGSSRFEVMTLGPFLARRGFAVIAIDGPSSGLGLDNLQRLFLKARFTQLGFKGLGEALLSDRAFDHDGDGNVDSGADMWSAYVFHTRDMVRQFALDYSQLVRVVRGFDGTRRGFDLDGDGAPELAGDFDADGVIDVGGDAPIFMSGGSLGGIMSMVMGGAEPEIAAIAPISGGAGFLDIAIRSMQNGVPQASMLRLMGPLYTGTLGEGGAMTLTTIITDRHRAFEATLGQVEGVAPGDLMVVENLENGERGCGLVEPGGGVRAGVASDVGDRTRLVFYRGVAVGHDCALPAGAAPVASFEDVEVEVRFRDHVVAAGAPLEALAEGFGLRRNDPDLRRVSALSQMVVDAADPVMFARALNRDPIRFEGRAPGGGHALVITTMGDMNVPAGSGATYARAAGIVDYRTVDPRYGKSVNQVLVDTYTVEAVHSLGRHRDPDGNPVHMDIEDFSGGDDLWGARLPRLDPPLRAGFEARDAAGGRSVAIFPMASPTGRHGFDTPGVMIDQARRACAEAGGSDCEARTTFDLGTFMLHMIAGYFASGGTEISADLCMSREDCPGLPAAPPPRSL